MSLCSQDSFACDRSFEFLQSLLLPTDASKLDVDQSTCISDMVGMLLPTLIRSLRDNPSFNGAAKQRKVSDFLGWLIQTRPDLCQTRFGGCLNWFVSMADRRVLDVEWAPQQKLMCLSSIRLLSHATNAPNDYFVRATLNRTGMLDSVLLMLLANAGADNMLSSTMQALVCKMAEFKLTSLIDGRAAKLVERSDILC